MKEEEKAKKEEEKAGRARKKAEKDAVKAEKEAAKAKVEQAQKKQKNMFGSWLAKAGTSPPLGSESGTFAVASTPMKQQRSSSAGSGVESSTATAPTSAVQSSVKKEAKSERKDYDRIFLPFHIKQGFEVAPINRFCRRKEVVKVEVDDMDEDEPETVYAIGSRPDMTASGEPLCIRWDVVVD